MKGKQLANVIHIRHRTEDRKLLNKIIYVENVLQDDGSIKKQIEVEESPAYTYYITKEEHWLKKPVNYIDRDLVRPVTTVYDNLFASMAKTSGQMEFFKTCLANGKWRELRALHRDPNLHLTDMDLPDYKVREWLERNKQQIAVLPITKAFYDIEVDTLNHQGFPEPRDAKCPVALISYIYQPTMTIWSFILRNPENESQTEFLELLEANKEDYAQMIVDEINEGYDPAKPFKKVNALKFKIYDKEEDLIIDFFRLVKRDKADFVAAWNGIFDLLTLKNRLLKKKVDPVDVMCPAEFPYAEADVREDEFSTDYRKRNSVLNVTGYSQWVEMLECFAKIRATMGMRESYKLEDILADEDLESKYEYEGDISDAMYVNFESFLKYSIYDSFRIYQLEEKNNDIDLLYNMGLMTATRFTKVMTKTTSIRNFAAMILEPQGYLLSNNHNRMKEEEEKQKFKGAFVALPDMMDNVGIVISADGKRSNRVIENVVDEDLSSMYPSIILAGNIDADTMIGKIICESMPELNDLIPGLLAENDVIRIGHELVGLPNFEEVVADLENLLA
jgi:DNA polymerase elongation subunit (family B)